MSEEPLPSIGRPAARAFETVGVTTLAGVASMSRAEASELHGIGPKALRILNEALLKHGLTFREE